MFCSSLFEFSLGGKWLYLYLSNSYLPSRKLLYVQPRYGFLFQILHAGDGGRWGVLRRPAPIATPVYGTAHIEPALTRFARGLTLLGDSFTRLHQTLIADLAGRCGLPQWPFHQRRRAPPWTTARTSVWRANTDKQQLHRSKCSRVRSLATFRCRRRPNTNSSAA